MYDLFEILMQELLKSLKRFLHLEDGEEKNAA